MKRLITLTLLATLSFTSWAKNSVQTVTQVSEAISLTADVDYHITSEEPFTLTGSIDIVNTEHAVVIMDNLRPTLAASYLSFIKINGEDAVDGTNCQLRFYNRGAILLPYGGSNFRPLTIFDEANLQGESYNQLTEGHNGSGFMKNLPTKWDNRIRSFRLKRGYMVTFALGDTGDGYSRCFIAADEDMEFTLPKLMDQRITSYRLFKWYDAGKAQLADVTDLNIHRALRTTSCYGWTIGGGLDKFPDAEFLVSRYKNENGWPSPGNVGYPDGSPHLKNDNEPVNPADEGCYSSYDAALHGTLDSWNSYMRTGRRMLTPSSWDGSNGERLLHDLMDSCDARGWRCDVIDMHCYWPEGSFWNLKGWVDRHHRPIWISEWVWGASWNNNGAFSGNVTQAQNCEAIKRITANLNSWDYIERYYYWNHEQWQSKVYDGGLTTTGQYYATMDAPIGYNGSVNYIPTMPRTYRPHNFKSSFTASSMTVKLSWTMRNGDLADSVEVLRAIGTSKAFTKIAGYSRLELVNGKAAMTYNDVLTEPGTYRYKIREFDAADRELVTDEEIVIIGGTEKGLPDLQYGSVTALPGEEVQLFLADGFESSAQEGYPVMISGGVGYANMGYGANAKGMVSNYIKGGKIGSEYKFVTFRENLWDGVTTATKQETTNFLVGKPANGTIGVLKYEMGFVPKVEGESGYKEGDITYSNAFTLSNKNIVVREVKFRQPFASKPVVMVTPLSLGTASQLTMWRVWDVTTEGFKVVLLRQEGNTVSTANSLRVGYFAIEQGQGSDGLGKLYTVSEQEFTFNKTTAYADVTFEEELTNPVLLAQLQTNYHLAEYENYVGAILRLANVKENTARVYMQVDKSYTDMIISTSKPTTETIGFIRISDDPTFDGITDAPAAAAAPQGVFTLSGIRLERPEKPGLYIVDGKKVMVK